LYIHLCLQRPSLSNGSKSAVWDIPPTVGFGVIEGHPPDGPEGGGAAEAGGGPGAVDYETADWGDGFAGGDDSASTVAPSDDYQTESLGEEVRMGWSYCVRLFIILVCQ